MRHTTHVALGLALVLAACGSDNAGGDDEGGGTDAPTTPDGDIPPPARGFQIVSPDITIMPGEEVTYCYYFRTPNTEELAIKKWTSVMTAGSHHMIMYTTTTDAKPPGTVDSSGCGEFGILSRPRWTYSAQTPMNELALPVDDGAGKPLGQRIAPNTPAYFQMHYLNSSDTPIQAHVTLNAEAHDAGVAFTETAPFITYNSNISIPPGATNDLETQTCKPSKSLRFWTMSTHAHKQAVKTEVKDGVSNTGTPVFTSMDWEHPGAAMWTAPPFYTFASGQDPNIGELTYECTYTNNGSNASQTIRAGSSAETNEMCMAVGYYFDTAPMPETRTLFCLNSSGPFAI